VVAVGGHRPPLQKIEIQQIGKHKSAIGNFPIAGPAKELAFRLPFP